MKQSNIQQKYEKKCVELYKNLKLKQKQNWFQKLISKIKLNFYSALEFYFRVKE